MTRPASLLAVATRLCLMSWHSRCTISNRITSSRAKISRAMDVNRSISYNNHYYPCVLSKNFIEKKGNKLVPSCTPEGDVPP